MSDPILYDYIKQAQTGEPEAILRLEEYMRLRDQFCREAGVDHGPSRLFPEENTDENGHKVTKGVLSFIAIVVIIGLIVPSGLFAPAIIAVCICGVMLYFLLKMREHRIINEYIKKNTPKPDGYKDDEDE